jgi:dihydroorotate dehydrogenase (NAD+) catalytic subunit
MSQPVDAAWSQSNHSQSSSSQSSNAQSSNAQSSNVQSSDQLGLEVDLAVELGRLHLPNPVLVASGTFGYAREMAGVVNLAKLGGILPKTITAVARAGNAPWRTVETSAGLLNSIGLDNDGIDYFIANHWPYLRSLITPIVISIAGRSQDDFVELAKRLDQLESDSGSGPAAIELNISCPNVSGGVDFGTDPTSCRKVVEAVRKNTNTPIVAKLTPNVTRIVDIAQAAADGGADAVACINTLLGMAIDWRKKKPLLGNVMGGLSGPAIKPVALRCVHQVRQSVDIPIIGIGGIATIDDAMEFFVAGASAIQIGTANYYDPRASEKIIDGLPSAIASLGLTQFKEAIGTLQLT